jgi:hypothetical protein
MSEMLGKAIDKATGKEDLPLDRRREILQREISSYARRGFRILSQTNTTAQLLKPKKFSFLWALLWFLLFGIGLLIYLLWYWSRRDETVYLEVTPTGRVLTRKG